MRFQEMSRDQAWAFVTDIEQLILYNVVFESLDNVDVDRMLHMLWEYDMVVPAEEDRLTLFVALNEKSCWDILDFICQFLSDDGAALPVKPWNPLSLRFQDITLRERFLVGAAKLTFPTNLFNAFACKCSAITPFSVEGAYDPMITVFMNNLYEYCDDENERRRVTLWCCISLCEQGNVTLTRHVLKSGSSVFEMSQSVGETSTVIAGLRGQVPMFKRDVGRAQHKFAWNYFKCD